MPARFSVLALCAASCLCLAVAATARADEPSEYVAPSDQALQPELPEFAACPSTEPPVHAEEELEGEEVPEVSPETRELGGLRDDLQAACLAQSERLDQVIERLWWVTANQLQPAPSAEDPLESEMNEWLALLSEQLEAPTEDLHAIYNTLHNPLELRPSLLGPEDEKPLAVSGEGEGGGSEVATAELASHIDASGEALKTALYLMLGTAVGGFIAYVLASAVRRSS